MSTNEVVPTPGLVRWAVLVPVKRLELAKSRLEGYDPEARGRLALAFAADVVTAVLRCPSVARTLVVTDDPLAARTLAALGADVVPDGGGADLSGPGAELARTGLNGALARAATLVGPLAALGVAVVPADLPALTSEDLATTLRAVPRGGRAFVCDLEGRGTTLLAASPGCLLGAAYGPDSRSRHLASGAVELAGTAALRRDVDDRNHLVEAARLGVGGHTTAVLDALG